MPYRISNRVNLLGDRMKGINPDPLGTIIYQQNSIEIKGITACLGNTEGEEASSDYHVLRRVQYFDFFIDTSDLVHGGEQLLPEVGDFIQRADGSLYRVTSMGDNDPPYMFITNSKNRMRVHTLLYQENVG